MWRSSGRPEAVAAGERACWWWAAVGSGFVVVVDNDDFVAAGEDVDDCDDAGPSWSLTNSYSTIYTSHFGPGKFPEAITFVIYQIRSRHCTDVSLSGHLGTMEVAGSSNGAEYLFSIPELRYTEGNFENIDKCNHWL